MFDRKSLTAEEIKTIIMRRDAAQWADSRRWSNYMTAGLNAPEEPENPALERVVTNARERIAEIIAQHLVSDEGRDPLVTEEEIDSVLNAVTYEFLEEANVLDSEERLMAERMIKASRTSMMQNFFQGGSMRKNSFDGYWEDLQPALELATERGIPATEIFLDPGTRDELIRRSQTREQFIAAKTEGHAEIYQAEKMAALLIDSLLAAVAWDSDAERQEAEAEFRASLLPKMQEKVELARPIARAWIAAEALRIFGPA